MTLKFFGSLRATPQVQPAGLGTPVCL